MKLILNDLIQLCTLIQSCWKHHQRKYPDELIDREIEEFHHQCSVWWYSLNEMEQDRFEEMADLSNAGETPPEYVILRPGDAYPIP